MTPKPPPGFELIPSNLSAPPPPPDGFELIDANGLGTAPYKGWGEYGRDLARTVGQGVTFGYGDELTALVRSAGETSYDQALAEERSALDRFKEQNPTTAFVGEVGGALATAPITPVLRGASALGSIAKGAVTGAGYGGLYGFGKGEGDVESRLETGAESAAWGAGFGGLLSLGGEAIRAGRRGYANTGERGAYGKVAQDLSGGADQFADEVAAGASRANVTSNRRTLDILGEEMQRHGGNRAAAQAATISRIVTETGVTPQTAKAQIRRLSDVHEQSALLLGEYPAVAGSDAAQRLRRPGNTDLDELGRTQASRTQDKLDYLANNGSAQSAKDVQNALNLRQEQLAPAMRETIEDLAPRIATGSRSTRPADITDTEQYVLNAQRQGKQEYNAAYQGPINNRVSLHFLPRVLDVARHQAAGRAGEPAAAIRRAVDQFYVQLPTGQRLAMNTLQQLQDARGAVRGQISEYHRAGRGDLAHAVQPLYERITRLMTHMSPQWARANERWRDMKFAEFAQELGDAFATKAGPQYRTQLKEFATLAPEAQEIVRVHFLQKLQDKLDNLGDSHSVSKLFATDHARTMVRHLFGPEAAVGFARAVRDQKVAEASQRMLGNSATHRRGVMQKQMDTETGLVAAVENANARGVRNWLLERTAQIVTEHRNRPMARILTTPMSDTAEVARHLHNMRTQEARLTAIDQRAPLRAPVAGGYAAGQIPEPGNDERFNPPMRLGGPRDAFAPIAPSPTNPPPAELRAWEPSPSDSAAFYAQRAAEMLGLPVSQAERIGGGAGGLVSLFTPVDDVSEAVRTGTAGSALTAGFSLLPGFKGAKAATEGSVTALRNEVKTLQDTFARLGGENRPRPADFEPLEQQAAALAQMKDQLTRDIAERRAANFAASPATSVPVTTSPQQEEVLGVLRDNPYVQAIKGRQGFPTKAEQERLTRDYFRGGGQMPVAPWGHTAQTAREAVQRVLTEAYAKGKKVSDEAVASASMAARQADEAAKELEDLRQMASVAEGRGQSVLRSQKEMFELKKKLEAAEKKAEVLERNLQSILARMKKDSD